MKERIYQLVAETLGLAGPHLIDEHSSAETHPEWGSMAQVNLSIALEAEYGISLSVDDIAGLTSVRAIDRVLQRYGVGR